LLLITLLASWLNPSAVERYALYPLLLGVIILGLPHGALDHLVPARLGLAWGHRLVPLGVYLLAYVLVAGLYFGLWLYVPLSAFTGFLVFTVLHWGHGDLRHMEIFFNRSYGQLWTRVVALLVRGCLPIVIPILAFPETAESLYRQAALGLAVQPENVILTTSIITNLLTGILVIGLLLYIGISLHVSPNLDVLLAENLELVVLVLFFLYTPAYFSVGLYFIAWHSLRHLGRLLILSPQDARAVSQNRWQQPLFRLTRDILPITLIALGLLFGLYRWRAANVTSLEGFVAMYLVLISALTAPHMVVVAFMDIVKRSSSNSAPSLVNHPK
jgi:Brp/Blh family beta-carotene 15,15'-monooxygenase